MCHPDTSVAQWRDLRFCFEEDGLSPPEPEALKGHGFSRASSLKALKGHGILQCVELEVLKGHGFSRAIKGR
jgi:hypothetical protein